MIVKTSYSTTTIELNVREALDHIRQLSNAVDRALVSGTGSFCDGCVNDRSPFVEHSNMHQAPGVFNVVVRSKA